MPADTTAVPASAYQDDLDSPTLGEFRQHNGRMATSQQEKRHKSRDCIDQMCTHVNHDLLVAKLFYFFFFSAFGSLFPLLAVYFKQLGMNATQCGVLIGFRPFVEFCSAPLWGGVADKWKKGKQILLFALFCWVAFTLAMAFIQPPAHSCLRRKNRTHTVMAEPLNRRERRAISFNNPFVVDVNQPASPFDGMSVNAWDGDDPMVYDHEDPEYIPYHDNSLNAPFYESYVSRPSDSEPDELFANTNMNLNSKSKLKKHSKLMDSIGHKRIFKRDYTYDANGGNNYDDLNYHTEKVPSNKIGMSPLNLDHEKITNVDAQGAKGLVSPPFSSIVYRIDQIQEAFLLLLLVIIIGEFFSAPAITLADSATLYYLGDDTENYGKQRMFGSLGWGLAMFFVGIALDRSTTFPEHPCGKQSTGEKNYVICFAVFSVLMSCAFITATQFHFHYDQGKEKIPLKRMATNMKDKVKSKVKDVVDGTKPIRRQRLEEEYDDDDQAREDRADNLYEDPDPALPQENSGQGDPGLKIELEKGRTDMVSDTTHEHGGPFPDMPKYITVLKLFATVHYASFLFVAWFMGFGIGLVFTFLFWHLQDLGGSPTLFGIASVINHLSEIMAYFFSNKLMQSVGHIKVLYIGLLGNVARFLYISWLKSPWWVLPFEFVQGLTHAAVWAACCSYVTQAIPLHLRCSAQGILQGLHHGLGRGCGAVFGGIFAYYFGTEYTFRGYGFSCLVVLALFFALNFFIKDRAEPSAQLPEEPNEILEESAHLAPCGVPMNPMSRNLSNSRLSDMDQSQDARYGATEDSSNGLHPSQAARQPAYNPRGVDNGYDQEIEQWPSMMDSYSQIKAKLGHKDAGTYKQMSNGMRNGNSPPEERRPAPGIVMQEPPPIQTDMHVLQPEPRLSETQYQHQDNW